MSYFCNSDKSSYLIFWDLGGKAPGFVHLDVCMFKNRVTLAHHLFQYLETSISNIKKKKLKKRHFGIVFSGDPIKWKP